MLFQPLLIVYISSLFNDEGALLAYAGQEDKEARITAAIASSIWTSYEKQGRNAFAGPEDRLQMTILQCENGNVAITKVESRLSLYNPLLMALFFIPGGQSLALPVRQGVRHPGDALPESQSTDQLLGRTSHGDCHIVLTFIISH